MTARQRLAALGLTLLLCCLALHAPAPAPASARNARHATGLCSDILFRKQSDDLFYDIRVKHIACGDAKRLLRRYRRSGKRCVPGWHCTYGVEVKWAVEPRVRFKRGRKLLYFGIPG
jgi:hypothetical protein